MNVGEGPRNPAEAKAAGYFAVLIDVARIIVVNEVVPKRLAKNNPCNALLDRRRRRQFASAGWAVSSLRNTSRLLVNHASGFSLVDQNVFTQLWH